MSLQQLSSQLKAECFACLERHQQMRMENRTPDFYKEVQPHVVEIDALLVAFTIEAKEWIQQVQPMYMHVHLIEQLEESMKQFVVQSFYKETGLKRFRLAIENAIFHFTTILRLIGEEESHADG